MKVACDTLDLCFLIIDPMTIYQPSIEAAVSELVAKDIIASPPASRSHVRPCGQKDNVQGYAD